MSEKKDSFAYGSLYLDEGETYRDACVQIKGVMKKYSNRVLGWFFDVIDYEDNRMNGEAMAAKIALYIKQKYPKIPEVHVGFSTTEETGETPRREK